MDRVARNEVDLQLSEIEAVITTKLKMSLTENGLSLSLRQNQQALGRKYLEAPVEI